MNVAKLFLLSALCAAALPGLTRAQATPRSESAPDSFYLSLLREGRSEMLRGDALAAKKSFRLACFGFLEQPVILAEGIVRLALAESALGDREAFVGSFSRLAEIEERFAAYAPAALSVEDRRSFEERALEWVAPETLRALPAFAPILARKSELDFAKLPPRERTRELERRSAAEPTVTRFKVLLAQDDAANDRLAKVLTRLEGVPDAAAGDSPRVTAGCLRGRALAGLKRCEQAVVPLAACAAMTADALLAAAQLDCLLTLNQADAARALAARIVKPAADAPAVRKAIARIPSPGVPGVPGVKAPPEKRKPPASSPTAPAKKAPEPKKGPIQESPPAKTPEPKQTPAGAPGAPAPVVPKATPAVATVPASGPTSTPVAPSAAVDEVTPAGSSAKKTAAKPPTELAADEQRAVATARSMLRTVDKREELQRGLALVRPVADRLPERADLQLLAGEIAYRAGQWATGAEYFRRSTADRGGPADPTLRFYLAVCLYEAGDFAGAAKVAATGLEKLQRPPFVDSYLKKIRAPRP